MQWGEELQQKMARYGEYDEIIQRSGDHPSDWMKNSTNVKNVKNVKNVMNRNTITITNQKQMRNLRRGVALEFNNSLRN